MAVSSKCPSCLKETRFEAKMEHVKGLIADQAIIRCPSCHVVVGTVDVATSEMIQSIYNYLYKSKP